MDQVFALDDLLDKFLNEEIKKILNGFTEWISKI